MIENSIGNAFAIFLAAYIISYIAGPFLINLGTNKYLRIIIYSIAAVVAGLLSYSTYSIPNRNIETLEAITLGIAMLVLALAVISPIVLFKNRKKHNQALHTDGAKRRP